MLTEKIVMLLFLKDVFLSKPSIDSNLFPSCIQYACIEIFKNYSVLISLKNKKSYQFTDFPKLLQWPYPLLRLNPVKSFYCLYFWVSFLFRSSEQMLLWLLTIPWKIIPWAQLIPLSTSQQPFFIQSLIYSIFFPPY